MLHKQLNVTDNIVNGKRGPFLIWKQDLAYGRYMVLFPESHPSWDDFHIFLKAQGTYVR